MGRHRTPPRVSRHLQRGGRRAPWRLLAAGLIVLAIAGGAWALGGGGDDAGSAGGASSVGAPVASGAVVGVSGVRIDAAEVDLGRIPLDVTAKHSFRVSNDGTTPVRLGRATIAVLQGC